MRTVDADALDVHRLPMDMGGCLLIDDVIEMIANAPTIETVNLGWISVKDGMPEEHDSIFARFYGTERWKTGMHRKVSNDVIACLEAKNGHRMAKVLSTQDGEWNVNKIYHAEVTHWMPFPELPEKEE